jgi:hypothetical protein
MPVLELDRMCADAVQLAQNFAEMRSGVFGVGEHLRVLPEDTRAATHYFACPHPGYPGWEWAVTVTRASRARVVTVSEIAMLPGDSALLAPRWVPWAERVGAGDIAPGTLHPTADDDPRLVPGYTGGDSAKDADPAEVSQMRALVAELGLGRERVLSPFGRDDAAERWISADGGPDNQMTAQAPALCTTCGFFIALAGSLGNHFGVCANRFSPQDAEVVTRDHGCGGHSDAPEPKSGSGKVPVWDTASVDDAIFD